MTDNTVKRILTAVVLAVGGICVGASVSPLGMSIGIALIAGYALYTEWGAFQLYALTIIYPVLPILLLILWNQSVCRRELVYLVVLISVHDMCAYVVGSVFGAHMIAPKISPRKSWEGFLGGTVCSVCIGSMYLWQYPFSWVSCYSWVLHVGVAVTVNGVGLCGDLFESYLKRRVGLKDSGSLLPGQGGIFDRVDSLLGGIVWWTLLRYWYGACV